MKQEVKRELNEKKPNVKEDDRFRETRINSLQTNRKEDLDAVQRLREHEKKSHKRRSVKNYETRVADANADHKNKTLIDFDNGNSNSISLSP